MGSSLGPALLVLLAALVNLIAAVDICLEYSPSAPTPPGSPPSTWDRFAKIIVRLSAIVAIVAAIASIKPMRKRLVAMVRGGGNRSQDGGGPIELESGRGAKAEDDTPGRSAAVVGLTGCMI
ncbi:MAG: hypothetical protein Q9160_007033 [Pyrenula sp. 1 TL-2023]